MFMRNMPVRFWYGGLIPKVIIDKWMIYSKLGPKENSLDKEVKELSRST